MIRIGLRTAAIPFLLIGLTLASSPAAHAVGTASSATPTAAARPVARPFPYGTALANYVRSRSGAYSVAVHVRGQAGAYAFTTSLPSNVTASIVKVDILATLLQQAQVAARPLSSWERVQSAAMIEQSDNAAATALWNHVGGGRAVAAFNTKVGMPGTSVGSGGYWGLTVTTATDQVALLDAITTTAGPLSATSRAYALDLMHHVVPWQAWGVTAGPLAGTTAVKNGWLPRADGWHVNSVGAVSSGRSPYTIAVLSTSHTVSEDYLIQTIAGLSRIIWQHQQLLPAPSPTSGHITHLLQQGSIDVAQVAILQTRMHSLGLWPAAADGHFDAALTIAVKTYQAAHHLTPDGVVGPLTGTALGIWG